MVVNRSTKWLPAKPHKADATNVAQSLARNLSPGRSFASADWVMVPVVVLMRREGRVREPEGDPGDPSVALAAVQPST